MHIRYRLRYIVVQTKKCIKCSEIRPLSRFRLRKDTGKYRNSCLVCDVAYFVKNHVKNRVKKNAQSRKWYENNKESAKERTKEWKKNNSERVKERRNVEYLSRKYKYNNDEEYRKKYRISSNRWRKQNSSKVAKYRKKYNAKLRVRISNNLRSRLRVALKGRYRAGSAVQDLGCVIEDFKHYLESLWKSGMTWDNYGLFGWHIDHIIPLANFDLTDQDDVKHACHYTNLQPLWAKDNLRKGTKTS